jgi:hypothetical protein
MNWIKKAKEIIKNLNISIAGEMRNIIELEK